MYAIVQLVSHKCTGALSNSHERVRQSSRVQLSWLTRRQKWDQSTPWHSFDISSATRASSRTPHGILTARLFSQNDNVVPYVDTFLFRPAWCPVSRSLHRDEPAKIYYSRGPGFLSGLRGVRRGASVPVISVTPAQSITSPRSTWPRVGVISKSEQQSSNVWAARGSITRHVRAHELRSVVLVHCSHNLSSRRRDSTYSRFAQEKFYEHTQRPRAFERNASRPSITFAA